MDGFSGSKGEFHLEKDNNYEQNQKDEEDLLLIKKFSMLLEKNLLELIKFLTELKLTF